MKIHESGCAFLCLALFVFYIYFEFILNLKLYIFTVLYQLTASMYVIEMGPSFGGEVLEAWLPKKTFKPNYGPTTLKIIAMKSPQLNLTVLAIM